MWRLSLGSQNSEENPVMSFKMGIVRVNFVDYRRSKQFFLGVSVLQAYSFHLLVRRGWLYLIDC
jgi:hypothetical protein